MPSTLPSLSEIKSLIDRRREVLDAVHEVRQEARGSLSIPLDLRGVSGGPARALMAASPGKRTFKLLAQGDSWFDYPPGADIIRSLHDVHGHNIVNIAVAGSTLNDIVYGPVPRETFGLPFGLPQSDDPSRIQELVHRIQQDKPNALLLSAGGNDIAGEEFFSFINNAKSGLPHVNASVLSGVIDSTFKKGFEDLINLALAAAHDVGISMPIFAHGYDYPWPDGRGVIAFLGWKVGPWFDGPFNEKNYPNNNPADLQLRHNIVVEFIDALNRMLDGLAQQYPGKFFHVNSVGTLRTASEWANELHPLNPGFKAVADKFDEAMQQHI